jgi:hypothetical protein
MLYRLFDTLGETNDDSLVYVEDFVEGINMQSWRIFKGERLAPVYPADARIALRKENRGAKLTSFIGNTMSMLLVASDIKRLIENVCGGLDVEYLPVTILDQRKRAHGKGYYIVNPMGVLDCLDLDKSDIEWTDDQPPEVVGVEELVLSRKKMKGAPELFRIREEPSNYVFGPKLADALKQHTPRPTNVFWTKLRYDDEV